MRFFWMACCSLLIVGGPVFSAEGEPLTLSELRAKYADPAGKIAVIGGVEVYYKDEGKGPVIQMGPGLQRSFKSCH